MFVARMEAVVSEEIAPGTPVWSIWNRLADRGELPKLVGPTPPHKTTSIWWGWLPDGIFFVTDMRTTASSFSCRIALYPRPKKEQDTPGMLLGFWLAKNLFRGKTGIKQDPHTYHYTFQGEGASFTLKYWTQIGFGM